MRLLMFVSIVLFPAVLLGQFVEKKISYELNDTTFESTVVYAADEDEAMPGILMVPNWMGPTEASLEKAKKIAGDDYVVMMIDMYGTSVRPENSEEAGKAAGVVRGDRALMRARMAKAHEVLLEHAPDFPLKTDQLAAIGFCFGGGTILEYARSGADVDAFVSFHGDLVSPTLEEDSGAISGKVLVLHGADDPYVPQEDVTRFRNAMLETDVDWQLVQFSNTVHSFTDPNAQAEGQAEYHPRSAKRAFEMMEALFEETF